MNEHNINQPYSHEEIIRYLSDDMTEKEMHDFEKASLEDTFLAHALEGYQNISLEDLKKLKDDPGIQPDYNSCTIIIRNKKTWIKAAAAIIIIFGLGTLGYYFFNKKSKTVFANNKLTNKTNNINDTSAISLEVKKDKMIRVSWGDTFAQRRGIISDSYNFYFELPDIVHNKLEEPEGLTIWNLDTSKNFDNNQYVISTDGAEVTKQVFDAVSKMDMDNLMLMKWSISGAGHTWWVAIYRDSFQVYNNFRSYRTVNDVYKYFVLGRGDCDAVYNDTDGHERRICYENSSQARRYSKQHGPIVNIAFTGNNGEWVFIVDDSIVNKRKWIKFK